METFYHGTSVLFKKFDIAHALEGDGKAKFGFGTYVTEAYTSAAHYAYNKKRPESILPSSNVQKRLLASRFLQKQVPLASISENTLATG